ncbi:MAG: TolC family protein [Bacteroidetes bacterium]|nr:TolC family protein [Bacteroidota bacterium]MBK8681513.1 TolC family protein [Bacteroidota bacterium]MBP9548241.1 TolC family protein [Chitinophagales bacterium]
MKKYLIIITIICLLSGIASAQQTISLQSAIDTALNNNLSVRNEKLYSEYQKKLKATAVDIPQTNLIGEFGQFNSAFSDNKFGIAQSISFPTVYAKQKSLQNENYKTSVLHIALKEAELKKQVSEVFYQIIYMNEKQHILMKIDSVYAAFLEKANLRFAKGESNILEKTTAETQRGQIAIQLKQIQQDIEILQMQFQLLLNTTIVYLPSANNTKMNFNAIADTSFINNHPSLQLLEQEKNVAMVNTQLQKSKLLPDLQLAYNNMSQQGMGADDLFYPKSERFSSVQFGIGIPLFFGAQKANIDAAKSLELISENNFRLGQQTLISEYESAFKKYEIQLATVKYFEETALRNADIISETATKQFENGDINYLEWTMLINNAISIQSNYIDSVNDLNQAIIHLNFLTSK